MPHCLIAGAGVIGLSLAWELAQRGVRVHVVERGAVGREASWAGAGILPPATTPDAVDPLDQLRCLSHQLHPQWADRLRDETGIDNGFRRCGGLYLATTIGEAASLHGLAAAYREMGIEIERLSLADVTRREPQLQSLSDSGRLAAAYYLEDEAQLRNPDHLRALEQACRQLDVTIETECELLSIERVGQRIASWETSGGRRQADYYCLTSGAWTYRLLHGMGIETGIMPVRGQMVMYRCASRLITHVLNQGPRYLVPREDGRLLVGSTEEEAGYEKTTTDEGLAELQSLAVSLLPGLAEAEVEKTWAGLRPGTFDGMPYLGSAPGVNNLFVASGHFRSGLHLSTGTAVVMRQTILGDTPAVDLTPFRLSRG